MFEFDELSIYKGDDIEITPNIIVTQPTLLQIAEFGEKRYFNAVHTLTAAPADLKWQLWDLDGTDYTTIGDYDLFIKFISSAVSSKKKLYDEIIKQDGDTVGYIDSLSDINLDDLKINPLHLVLKNIDLADFTMCTLQGTDETILYDVERKITIDRIVYTRMVEAVRKIHGFKRNNETPANETTKMVLIETAREDAMIEAKKPYRSVLKPLISAMTVKCGLCGDDRIWNMPIGMFFDNVKRMNRIQESQLLLQGAYSGFASLKGVDKERLDWAGNI